MPAWCRAATEGVSRAILMGSCTGLAAHDYLVDQPLLNGSALHGVTTSAPNLARIVAEGETASEWLRLRIDPRTSEIFS